MERSDKRQGPFFQENPEYHGSLCSDGVFRLAISPNGLRYLLQMQSPGGGSFRVVSWRKRLSALLPHMPETLAMQAGVELPDDPADVPRPWAQASADASAKLSAEWDAYKALPARKRKLARRPGLK
jgi:hypothetical protein